MQWPKRPFKRLQQELSSTAEAKLASAVDEKAKERASRELKDAPTEAGRRAAIGASWYAARGRPGFRGRRLLSISGDLERPGVYEVPIGLTLGELIDLAGGVKDGKPLGAVAPSGPSGGLLPALLPAAPDFEGWLRTRPEEVPVEQWRLLSETVRAGIAAGIGMFDIRMLPLDLLLVRLIGPALSACRHHAWAGTPVMPPAETS